MIDKPFIIGCDECGTGALAYSLVVVGVRAPKDWRLEGLNDSKKLSAKKREALTLQLEKLIADGTITWALAERSNLIIDQFGMAVALKDAYVEVFRQLYQPDSLIISDGQLKFDRLGVENMEMISMVKADTKIPQVMAASILGKVYRDGKMKLLHQEYPVYGWEKNVGYGSSKHLEALQKYGPSPLHRFSYKPIQKLKFVDPNQLPLFQEEQ